jgi:hypothetical protein
MNPPTHGAGRAERARRIEDAIHSGQMEGRNVTPATRADAQEYVEGKISARQLRGRVRARYGLACYSTGEGN